MKRNIGINALLNAFRRSLSIIFPLITYPYVLRVLGAEGVGKVSYSASIISYFSLFAMLGVTQYGLREGAKRRDDKQKLNIFANELFSLNIIFCLISYCLLAVTIVAVPQLHEYRFLLILQSSVFLFDALSIDWVTGAYEDYWLFTVISIFSHIVNLVLLFSTLR